MVKNILIIFFCIINFINIKAQQKNICGMITNTDDTPGIYMLVSFEDSGKTIKSIQTDSIGRYNVKLELPSKGCRIKVSNWGNILYEDTIPYTTQSRVSKDIHLEDINTIQMNEVVVQAVRNGFSVKGNKLVYVPKEALLKSNNVFDVLKQTPLIQATDDAVSIIAKKGTLIYINGTQVRIPLETLIENLKTMPADNLKDIQITTNPGAEYQSSTTGGIINITLKKNFDEGFWGQITAQDRQRRKNSQDISPNLRYRKGSIGIDGTVSLSNNNSKYKGDNVVEMKDTGEGQYTKNTDNYKTRSINTNINVEYELNEQHSFNLLSMLRFSKPKISSDSYTNYYNVYSGIANDTITHTDTEQKASKINSYFFNLSYVYKIDDKGQKLALSADYMDYDYTQNQYTKTISIFHNNSSPLRDIASYTPQKIKSYSIKADYTLPFGKNSFNTGAYYSYNQNKTSYNETENNILDIDATSRFLYDEYLTAGYLKLARTWNDKLSTSIGLRAEYMRTKRDLQSVESGNWKENKFNLFPSLNINYVLNEHWTFNYSLSNKVERPAFWQLNPSKFYINNNLYAIENPFLKNTYITSQELSLTLNNKYYFAIGYDYVKDGTSQFMLPDKKEEGVNFYNRYNYGNDNNLSFSLSAPVQFFSNSWSSNVSLGATYNYYIYTDIDLRQYYKNNGSWNGYISVNNTFALSQKKQFWAYLNVMYSTPFIEIYKRNTLRVPFIDFELKKIWSNWSISFKVNSILGFKVKSTVLNNDISPYLINSFTTNGEPRVIQLRVTYSFGNSNTKKNRQSQLANGEVQKRVQ